MKAIHGVELRPSPVIVMMVMVAAVRPVPVVVVIVIVVVATPGHVDLAMLMIAVPIAIEVPAVWVAMHMAMMVAVPVIPVDVDILRQLHDPGLGRCGWPERSGLGCCRGKCQEKTSAKHRQRLCVRHEDSPLERVRFTSVHVWWWKGWALPSRSRQLSPLVARRT